MLSDSTPLRAENSRKFRIPVLNKADKGLHRGVFFVIRSRSTPNEDPYELHLEQADFAGAQLREKT